MERLHTKQRRLRPTDSAEFGDKYVFVALDAIGKAIVSYRVGKRDGGTTLEFVTDLRRRVVNSPLVSSDSFPAYGDAFSNAFGRQYAVGGLFVGLMVLRSALEPRGRSEPANCFLQLLSSA